MSIGSSSNVLSPKNPINNRISDITAKMRQSPQEIEFDTIDDMDHNTIDAFNQAKIQVAQTEKYSITAKEVVSKTSAALVALDNMRKEITDVYAEITGYNQSSMTPERLAALKAKIHGCLGNVATGLNSIYGNGQYIFGSPKNESIKPVNEAIVTLSGNVAPDGSITDSFVYTNAKSADKIVAISDTTSVGTAISASNPAFVNILGGIWGVLTTLNAAPAGTYPVLPQASIDTLNKGWTEFSSLTTQVKEKYDLAEAAIAENTDNQDDAKQKLDSMKINYLQEMQNLQQLRHTTDVLMALATSIMRNEAKITDTIAAAAA
jgi:hypothetical protein